MSPAVIKTQCPAQARIYTQTFKKGGSKLLIKMDFRYNAGEGEGGGGGGKGGKISSHRNSHQGLSLHL